MLQAFDATDQRSALQRYPELAPLYPLVEQAKRFAKEKWQDPGNQAAFIAQVKEQWIQNVVQGKAVSQSPQQPTPQQQKAIEQEQEWDIEP